ncbi:MAG: Stk1 family PASTA domain-containing Ser/Thr kinase [Eubacteriaceae bacterium]|nr:Stk1 family PASTA domain-containing Ser/Thr kinase [Eubacteriaceae bacterium]
MSKLLAGRYELIDRIGEGGMAVVYKAKDRLLNRYIAVKILRPEYTRDVQFVENFRKESQAAAGLQHPNIVSVYDVGTEGNIHYIVMELINGRPLSDIIKEKAPMPYSEVVNISRQVASALSVAHKHNIIHRDVKPHNIMITTDGMAKLADFGIAKAVSDSTLASSTSRIIGSVHYFSPEQARGSYVDERSDIYSLGIVIYEMLTGQVPFDGDNPVQVALMHINDDIVAPSKLTPGIPPALEKLVMKATDKFQSNRFESVDALISELDNIEFVSKMVGKSILLGNDYSLEDTETNTTDSDLKKTNNKKGNKDTGKSESKKNKHEDSENTANNKKKNKNKNRKKLFIGIAAGIAVLLIALGVAFATGLISSGIDVPDLKNMTVKEAEEKLKELKLEIKVGEEVPSDDVEKGKIASQTPEQGTKLKAGEEVTVMVSSGKPTGEVPSLIGKVFDEEVISTFLLANNYALGDVTRVESDSPEGEIIDQTPSAGTEVETGTKIDIVVSKGTSKIPVPNLIGRTVDDAKQLLKDAGLKLGKVSYEESSVYKANVIMGHDYENGEKVEKGTSVDIIVSKGEPDIAPPDDTDTPDDPAVKPDDGEDSGNENTSGQDGSEDGSDSNDDESDSGNN